MHGQDAIRRIRRQADRLRTLEAVDARTPAFVRWFRETRAAFDEIFGAGKGPAREFQLTIFEPLSPSRIDPDSDWRHAYEKGVPIALSFFDSVVRDLSQAPARADDGSTGAPEPAASAAQPPAAAASQAAVAVLAGGDSAAAEVTSFLESLGAAVETVDTAPDSTSQSAAAGDALGALERLRPSLAVVLLAPTARSGGRSGSGPAKTNAKANANAKAKADTAGPGSLRPSPARMFELGYLLGRLGARRVCGLLPRGVELPFPISGATILTLDAGGAWRDGLASVLRSASD
jgi:hypothetical protein